MKHEELIRKLTLEEKCYLLSGKDFWNTVSVEAKGIPSIRLSDGPHGVRKQEGAGDQLGLNGSVPATCFPTAATVANSWNQELAEQIGEALGEEAACQQVAVLLGPGLNIKRNPLCGRNFEYFSEDPYLAGKMAAGYIRGIQKSGISACPLKARLVYKIMTGMLNKSIAQGKPDLNIIFAYNMPFRAIGKMAGGGVSQDMCRAIVSMVNGHAGAFFGNLGKLVGGYFRQSKVQKKQRAMK